MFLTLSYGPLVGFLYGWSFFLVVNTGAIAALSVTFSTYLGYLDFSCDDCIYHLHLSKAITWRDTTLQDDRISSNPVVLRWCIQLVCSEHVGE